MLYDSLQNLKKLKENFDFIRQCLYSIVVINQLKSECHILNQNEIYEKPLKVFSMKKCLSIDGTPPRDVPSLSVFLAKICQKMSRHGAVTSRDVMTSCRDIT